MLQPIAQGILINRCLPALLTLLVGLLGPLGGELPPGSGMRPVVHQGFGKELLPDGLQEVAADRRVLGFDGQKAGIAGLPFEVGFLVCGANEDGAALTRRFEIREFGYPGVLLGSSAKLTL